jgi:hypothetical protein
VAIGRRIGTTSRNVVRKKVALEMTNASASRKIAVKVTTKSKSRVTRKSASPEFHSPLVASESAGRGQGYAINFNASQGVKFRSSTAILKFDRY